MKQIHLISSLILVMVIFAGCDSTNKMEEVHLISRTPDQSLYNTDGGFLHIVWQKSTFKRTDS